MINDGKRWWDGPTLDPHTSGYARCRLCHGRIDAVDEVLNQRRRRLLEVLRTHIPRPSPLRPLAEGRSIVRLIRDSRRGLDVGGWTASKAIGVVLCDVLARGLLELADAGHPPEVVASLQLHAFTPPRARDR